MPDYCYYEFDADHCSARNWLIGCAERALLIRDHPRGNNSDAYRKARLKFRLHYKFLYFILEND